MRKRILKLWRYVSNNALWSALIAGLILLAIGALSEEFRAFIFYLNDNLWSLFLIAYKWLSTEQPISGWILACLAVGTSIAVAFAVKHAWSRYEIVRKEQNVPDYVSYNVEKLYGISWCWKWKKDRYGNYVPNGEFGADCPKCRSVLQIDTFSVLNVTCVNDNCNWQWNASHYTNPYSRSLTYDMLRIKLVTEIDRKIKTGEYKDHL